MATGAGAGAVGGAVVGGPVGAVVGGVGGAIVGGMASEQSPRFHEYVATQKKGPRSRYNDDVAVGAVLPADGPSSFPVPTEYGVKEYRYSVVNGHTVFVDPRTRRIVQIVD